VYRVLAGPSLPDRVVALELMTTIAVGLLAVAAAATDRSEYLDVAVVLVLVSFVGAVGFASYLQRGR
jgi:multicomponent Na+:H+ antiporter subunit F